MYSVEIECEVVVQDVAAPIEKKSDERREQVRMESWTSVRQETLSQAFTFKHARHCFALFLHKCNAHTQVYSKASLSSIMACSNQNLVVASGPK